MKNLKNLLYFLFLSTLIISCSSDNGGDPEVVDPPQDKVTYTGTVKAIIDNNCISCHANTPVNGAPMSLTTYANVKEAVENRNLISRIEDGSMPAAGDDLSAAQVQAVKDWQTDGFEN